LRSIYKATNQDIPTIRTLAIEIWNENYKQMISQEQIDFMLEMMYSISALEKQFSEGHEFWMLRAENTDLGYCSISKKEPHVYFINKLYLKTDQHGSGLGTEFLNDVLSNYADWNTIRLTVNRTNYKSINFYFKNRFKIESVANFDIGNNFLMEDFIMIKKR
jgi:GNAT superfamily N-acetyltransferase